MYLLYVIFRYRQRVIVDNPIIVFMVEIPLCVIMYHRCSHYELPLFKGTLEGTDHGQLNCSWSVSVPIKECSLHIY